MGNLSALAQLAGDAEYATDDNFLAQLPVWIQQGELRIWRDLDLLSTRVYDATGTLTQNSRIFILPTSIGTFQVIETLQVIDENGIRQPPLEPMSKDCLDMLYPDEHAVGDVSVPLAWAPLNQAQILVGPAPSLNPAGANYEMLTFGTQRPASLSEANTTTFITLNLPDVFIAAEMIQVSAWQRLFSAMSEDPAAARDWNQEYERLMKGADVEELRKKISADGWSTRIPNPVAKPPQT